MENRQLGASSVYISPITLGTWAIGGWMWGGTDEKQAISAIRASIDAGITTIDTAAVYGFGLSEQIIGKAIKGRRDQVVIATKCGMRWDTDVGSEPWHQKDMHGRDVIIRKNSRPESIIHECEQSLKRLGVDVIDLYQIHWPDSSTPFEDSWNAMVKLQHEGKVRAIGVSNYSLEQLRHIHEIRRVDSLQPPYSLIRRGIEKDLLPFCQRHQIGVLAYSPLERGLLTGRVGVDREFAKGDHRRDLPMFSKENRKKALIVLEEIRPIADKHRATLSQIILNCTIHMPGITAAIVGARGPDQALENAKAGDLVLTKEERLQVLMSLSALEDLTK
jgi:aryl-alcohol dehydrogenase-like predicted oxidoreductase